MSEAVPYKNLLILLGTIRQESGEGELVLAQSDGVRRFSFLRGELISLSGEAAGEQFSSYLLRQGLLGLSSLNELLANDDGDCICEKVLQWGLLSLEERDNHLQCLQEQIMIHALEHPVLHWTWHAGSPARKQSQHPPFKLQYRPCLWRAFQESDHLLDLLAILKTESAWKWEGQRDLLDRLSDLPLTSGTAYALSFLTTEPISFETFHFLSNLDEEDAGRLLATLWALGAVVMSSGKLPSVTGTPSALAPFLPLIMPPPGTPYGPPKQRVLEAPIDPDQLYSASQLEFLDLDPDSEENLALQMPMILEMPPCGPRPQPRAHSLPLPNDLPPCGLRPQPRPQSPPPMDDLPPCGLRPQPRPQPPPPLDDMPPCGPRPQSRSPLDSGNQSDAIALDPDRKGVSDPPTPQSQLEARRLLDRAHRQVMLGHTVEAVSTLEQAVQLQPDGDAAYKAWLLLGQLRMANLTWSTRAIQALQNASRICPAAAEPWTAMGEIYRRIGLEPNAVACFQKALALDPSVAIPPDVDLKGTPSTVPHVKPTKKGLFGGRGGKP